MLYEHNDPLSIVDSHLDLAENVTRAGRDLTLSVSEIRKREGRTANQATVSLPELERGCIAVAFATVTAGLQPGASISLTSVPSGARPVPGCALRTLGAR